MLARGYGLFGNLLCDLSVFAYRDVGKERELGAEAWRELSFLDGTK